MHWYSPDGKPQHFVKAKNGNMRDSTLRDAKKNGWYPSVSGIIGILAKPGLETWKQNQILEACWNTEIVRGDDYDAWSDNVKKLAAENSTRARDRGNEIHDAIEKWIKSGNINSPITGKYALHVDAVFQAVKNEFSLNLNDLEAETTFASSKGYAGMIDAISRSYEGSGLVLDWKTKSDEFDDKTRLAWDDHAAQLAAYRHGIGLDNAICANVFISPSAKIRIHIWGEEELQYAFEGFLMDLKRWKHKNRYFCGEGK